MSRETRRRSKEWYGGAVFSFQSTMLAPLGGSYDQGAVNPSNNNRGMTPMWTKPAFTDLRIGFEVTMYFANR